MSLANGRISISVRDLTPRWLKDNYLTGMRIVDDTCGKEFPDSFFETHMENAVAKLEMLCDICIMPLTITAEEHDYFVNDYLQWGFISLFKVPVKQVTELRGVFPLGAEIVKYPAEWIQIRADVGQLNVVPNHGALGAVIIGQGGDFLPLMYGGISTVPNLWQVDYVAGMDLENLPRPIVEAIAKLACIDILTVVQDLIRPIGVTSQSVSIDGLSQSQGYQIPAFKARVDQYTSDLYGPAGKQQIIAMSNGLLKQIFDRYRPLLMVSM